ncbi:OmpA family protein [Paracoccus sp. YIM 132242]|uniref:OmpA family protein n=1 Tax=Paracoccus lichenicola TaxID=2665644 RepID=A0A6L6HN82_9RHOB|nr:OmpA family protein [Paracoccus lichenicola]MTD99938.1 OmpA family protein [Paracoccus lichenicola]
MRRIIHNTTAIAACLSLLVPQLAQAQPAVPPGQPPAAQAAPKPQRQRAEPAEPAPQRAERQPRPERQQPEAAQAKPDRAERPAQAAREQQRQRPADSAEGRAAQQEEKPQRARDRAARQSAGEEATERGQAERPEEPARRQNRERPEQAARQQNGERPAGAARDGQAERPAPRRQQATPAPEPRDEQRPQRAGGGDPRAQAPDRERRAGQPPAAGDNAPRRQAAQPAAPVPGETPDERTLREKLERDQRQRNVTTEGQGRPQRAGERAPQQARQSEASREAARETRAAPAAALNEDSRGEVVEQRITRENSRSSDEDFATSLREAVQPQAPRQARNNDEDNDDNDLAKALLLGLGAVAVGSYLNNNRQVALSAPDRVVVTRADGSQELIKDDTALLRQPGSTVATENFDDGSSRTVVTRADGSRVVTIRDADLRVLRRTLVSPDGTQTRLIDDTAAVEPVDIATLPAPAPAATPGIYQDEAALREALRREVDTDRRFTLGQVRSIPEVRSLAAPVNIDAITFDSGSAAISPDQARQLSTLGSVIQDAIAENPREVFLIEGHTDLVGSDAANLALSDRRAESVALALTEYFQVPPENLVVQGYGEQFPQVRQDGDVRENRRAAIRRITDLLQTAEAQ